MDYKEAEAVLRQHAAAYAGWTNEMFLALPGREQHRCITTRQGHAYTCAVEVETVPTGGADIEVFFTVSAADGPTWFPALVSAHFTLSPGGRWEGKLGAVRVQRPWEAAVACGGCLLIVAATGLGVGWLVLGVCG
jgi:hypothetical protein